MTHYGRQNGRGMVHVLVETLDDDRGLAACGAPIVAMPGGAVEPSTVCRTCLACRPIERPAPDHGERISLPDASRVCGLALSSLQQAARLGRLKTEQPSAKVRLTTRRWLRDYLDSRPERFKRRQARPTQPSTTLADHRIAAT